MKRAPGIYFKGATCIGEGTGDLRTTTDISFLSWFHLSKIQRLLTNQLYFLNIDNLIMGKSIQFSFTIGVDIAEMGTR